MRLLRSSRPAVNSFPIVPRNLVGRRWQSLEAGVWAPTRKTGRSNATEESTLTVLEAAGFIYQAHSGIFHTLPLGLRVLNKINRVVDRNMESIGGQKVSMSSLSTQEMWSKTGRYQTSKEQLFSVLDRRESKFLLAPTHEEEITAMIAASVRSAKELPLRLYQIGPKYRDEPRPRQGLLRAREFVMKDLYTFDTTPELAVETYDAVRKAYDRIFASLGLPVVVAEADSGMMGGIGSHEYHLVSDAGEDTLLVCDNCQLCVNTEVAGELLSASQPGGRECPKCSSERRGQSTETNGGASQMSVLRAVELAHTFNLGTRYSIPLGATLPSGSSGKPMPLHMGCHGIGISRVLGALAASKVDSVGLNWRPGVAPYDVAVLARSDESDHVSIATDLAQSLRSLSLPSSLLAGDGGPEVPVDVLFENRQSRRSLIWRLNDADMAGYPILVVAPVQPKSAVEAPSTEPLAEVQCRQLKVKTHVPVQEVPTVVKQLLERLLR